MVRRPKLTQEMVDEAIALKADGLSNGDIICALGIHESTFYRWIGNPKNRLQRALSEGLKKEESAFKRTQAASHRSLGKAKRRRKPQALGRSSPFRAVTIQAKLGSIPKKNFRSFFLSGDPRILRDHRAQGRSNAKWGGATPPGGTRA